MKLLFHLIDCMAAKQFFSLISSLNLSREFIPTAGLPTGAAVSLCCASSLHTPRHTISHEGSSSSNAGLVDGEVHLISGFCLAACQPGFFKDSPQSPTCTKCPPHSYTQEEASTSCVCEENYYRKETDPPTMACTSELICIECVVYLISSVTHKCERMDLPLSSNLSTSDFSWPYGSFSVLRSWGLTNWVQGTYLFCLTSTESFSAIK